MAIPKSKTSSETYTPEKKLLVAAIDFGTTYSGWAYCFDPNCKYDPSKISFKHWCSGKYVSFKAPTTVLIQPDGCTLEAFGYEAEDRYTQLADEREHKTYYYFERFKMMLFDNKNLSRKEELEDDKGKRLPAKLVFAMAIKYLKDDLIEETEKKLIGLLEDEIQWVLTVPAIWNPLAKQFMRECAVEAGIQSANLLIALEPEAASLYCKYLTIQKEKEGTAGRDRLSSFQPGARYMVVDAGGGTVDIIVHEVCSDGSLKEICKPNGGDWGGTTVDKAFFNFLASIVGKNVMKRFEEEHKDDFLDMQREFELKKRCIKPNLNSKVKIKIPVLLTDIYKDVNNESVMERIEKDSTLNVKIIFKADKILVESRLLKDLFNFASDHLVHRLEKNMREEATTGLDTILMVGGFSESPMVFDAVRSAFRKHNVLLPEDAGLSVLKGAVIFGHDRKDISIRVSQYTYGFNQYLPFNPMVHPIERLVVDANGDKKARDCFTKLIEVGESLTPNKISKQKNAAPFEGTSYILRLFASRQISPIFVDEPDCFKVGEMKVDCKDNEGNVGSTLVQLMCGGTEFEAQAIHKSTGKETKGKFSFLD